MKFNELYEKVMNESLSDSISQKSFNLFIDDLMDDEDVDLKSVNSVKLFTEDYLIDLIKGAFRNISDADTKKELKKIATSFIKLAKGNDQLVKALTLIAQGK